MKKLVLLISVAVILVLVSPVLAGAKEPVGPSLGWDVVEFPENTAFHMRHGWLFGPPPVGYPTGSHSYALELDGEILMPDFRVMFDHETGSLVKIFYFNFPDGMTGVHDFTHHYFGPCYMYFEDCEFPHKVVEAFTIYQTITFTVP
jgi:hypothetical protein